MGGSPGTRRLRMARAAIVGATVFASITSSTVVIGLDIADSTSPVVAVTTNPVAPDAVAPDAVADPASARVAVVVPTAATDPDDPCDAFPGDYCDEVPAPRTTPKDVVGSCADGKTRAPTGTTDTIPADGQVPEGAYRIRIEVERGLGIDGECFAGEVLEILNDARSWATRSQPSPMSPTTCVWCWRRRRPPTGSAPRPTPQASTRAVGEIASSST